ncbi:MAG TPA: hypothetical protein VGB79_05330 [Allosphingosinicella sp.]
MQLFGLSILLLSLAAPGARAPDPAAEAIPQDQDICVGGPDWHPSLDDARSIEDTPVPASFRTLFESVEPCVRWAMSEHLIVDWHMRFGSERSIAAALAYLERDYMSSIPPPARHRGELERAWRAAGRDLARAQAIRQPENLEYSLRYRFMERSRPIQLLNALVEARLNYRFLAEQHLRAAEEFGSATLLARAEPYLHALTASELFLAPLQDLPAASTLSLDLDTFRTDDLRMRAAVLRAQLSRSAADVAAAEALLDQMETSPLRRLAEEAYSGGDDFCDIGSGSNDAESLQQFCQADDAAAERAINFAISRAALDLLGAKPRHERMADTAVRLLERVPVHDTSRCCGRSEDEALLRLRLTLANFHRRRFADGLEPDETHLGEWGEALAQLREAERLAPPHSAPARFERIARQWLTLSEIDSAAERRQASTPEFVRYSAYLRHLLANLEAIRNGNSAR